MRGPCGRCRRERGLVGLRIEQCRELRLVLRTDAHDPAAAVGIAVDELRLPAEIGIARDDLTAHRAVDVRGGLDRFDDGAGFTRHDPPSRLRHLDEHQVSERLLRVVGDADGDAAVGFEPRPLVGLEISKICRDLAHDVLRTCIREELQSCHCARTAAGRPPRRAAVRGSRPRNAPRSAPAPAQGRWSVPGSARSYRW